MIFFLLPLLPKFSVLGFCMAYKHHYLTILHLFFVFCFLFLFFNTSFSFSGNHCDPCIRQRVVSSTPHYAHSGVVEAARDLYMQVDGNCGNGIVHCFLYYLWISCFSVENLRDSILYCFCHSYKHSLAVLWWKHWLMLVLVYLWPEISRSIELDAEISY